MTDYNYDHHQSLLWLIIGKIFNSRLIRKFWLIIGKIFNSSLIRKFYFYEHIFLTLFLQASYKEMKFKAVYFGSQSASVAQLDAPSDWRPGGRGFNPRRGRQHSFVVIDHEIFSTVILSLPLIQEEQLSVSGERMCTILVKGLED